MQVIYRSRATLRAWSALQHVEHRDLFLEVVLRLEVAASRVVLAGPAMTRKNIFTAQVNYALCKDVPKYLVLTLH